MEFLLMIAKRCSINVMLAAIAFNVPQPAWGQNGSENDLEREKTNRLIQENHERQRREQIDRSIQALAQAETEAERLECMSRLFHENPPVQEVVPLYQHLLDDKSDRVKLKALQILGEYDEHALPAVPRVIELLLDRKRTSYVNENAAAFLGQLGPATPEIVPSLIEHLEKPQRSIEETRSVLQALGRMGPAAGEGVAVVESYMDHRNILVQLDAYLALGRIRDVPRPPLSELRAVDDGDVFLGEVGFSAFMAIQDAGEDAEFAVPILLDALKESHPAYIRCMAVQTLGMTRSSAPEAVQAMVEAMASDEPIGLVSGMGQQALAKINARNNDSVPILSQALSHSKPVVRQRAAEALKKYGSAAKPAVPALVAALKDADGKTDEMQVGAYLEALRAIGPEAAEASAALVGLLDERSQIYEGRAEVFADYLRAFILVTLTDVGVPESALPHILDGLANSDASMVHMYVASAAAAGALGPRAHQTVPYLMRALEPEFQDNFITFDRFMLRFHPQEKYTSGRIEAIRALAKIGPAAKVAIPLLEDLAKHEHDPTDVMPPYADEARKALDVLKDQ